MKNTKLTMAVHLVLVSALASPLALAEDSFWYMGLNLGAAKATIDNERVISGLLNAGFTTTSLFNDTQTNGGRVFGGYQFNRYFAMEGGYFDIGDYSYSAQTLPAGTLDTEIRVRGYNLDVLGFIPVTDRFSIFGRAGANYADVKGTLVGGGAVNVLTANTAETGTNLKMGLGLQFAFTENFRMRVETERYRINDSMGNKGDIDMVTVGMLWKFGAGAAAPVPVAATPPPRVVAPAPAPAPVPVPTQQYCGTLDLNFEINKSDIQVEDHEKLRAMADFLRQFPAVTGVIEGHTDNVGSPEANMRLSQRRADSVVAHLVNVHGISPSRIRAVAFGESRPTATNSTQEGMRQNRRIEAKFACATGVAGIELLEARETVPLEISFAHESTAIDSRYHQGMRQVADFLNANPAVRANIEGHGSNSSEARSVELSRLRAQAVADYLVNNLGIERSRLNTEGFGEARRDAYNTTAAGRQDNRRVSIVLVYPR